VGGLRPPANWDENSWHFEGVAKNTTQHKEKKRKKHKKRAHLTGEGRWTLCSGTGVILFVTRSINPNIEEAWSFPSGGKLR